MAHRCPICSFVSPPEFRYCGECGTLLERGFADEVSDLASHGSTAASRGADHSRPFPKRTLIVGAVLLVVGLSVALATFAAIQAQGSLTSAQTFGGPVVNWLLGLAGIDSVQAPEGGQGASGAVIGGFLIGIMLTAFGGCLLAIGGLVALVRLRPWAHVPPALERAQPTVERLKTRMHDAIDATSGAGLTQAAEKGREAWRTEAAPRLSDAAERGRKGWESSKPKATAAAVAGSRRVSRFVRERGGRRESTPGRAAALSAGAPSPGWYDDPGDVRFVRYWDGSRWTESVVERTGAETPRQD